MQMNTPVEQFIAERRREDGYWASKTANGRRRGTLASRRTTPPYTGVLVRVCILVGSTATRYHYMPRGTPTAPQQSAVAAFTCAARSTRCGPLPG